MDLGADDIFVVFSGRPIDRCVRKACTETHGRPAYIETEGLRKQQRPVFKVRGGE